jgi:hypothetical protein
MWGQCRRHSPHLSPVSVKKASLVEGVWPLIRDDDWCGEWRAPTRTSVSRSRFAPRSVDMPGAAPSEAPSSVPAEAPEVAVAAD